MLEILLIILVIFLLSQWRRLSMRLSEVEKQLGEITARAKIGDLPAGIVEDDAPEGIAATSSPAKTMEEASIAEAAEAEPETDVAEPFVLTQEGPARPERSFESYIGARWPVWVGGVALAFGGIFLVRYSIEAGLLGPAARLALAALFGLMLIGAGELVRRRAMPKIAELYANAMIPGALTAAGSVTLFGAIYAAHAIYGFIAPGPAFAMLGLTAFLTIALSLLHGQALAGLGLLAALLVPAMIEVSEPNPTSLFAFLSVTWLAVNAASRLRRWTVVPMLANFGLTFWILFYVTFENTIDPLPPTIAVLVAIAGTIFLWPGRHHARENGTATGWLELINRPPLNIVLSLSAMTILSSLAMLQAATGDHLDPLFASTAMMAALAALGGGRRHGVWAAILAAAGAILSILAIIFSGLDYIAPSLSSGQIISVIAYHGHEVENALLLGAVFTLIGFAFLRRFGDEEREFSIVWAYLAGAMPAKLGFISLLNFGSLTRDWEHGLYGAAMGAILLVGAQWRFSRQRPGETETVDWPANLLVAGSFAGFMLALHALTAGIVTTILIAILGFAYLLAGQWRNWPALPWMMAAAIAVIFGRIAWQPTLVGPASLGTTPFFNALLPGYGIPTLLAIISAYLLRNSADIRLRNVMQGLASLAALLTIAVLVRHAMNGGVLDSRVPTLGEQSIYTLVTIGFSGVLMTLDLKSPSPVFRFGSMLAGVIATLNVLSMHVFTLNPFFSGEDTGHLPFVNLLLIGYLLPAGAYALTAYLARERRPMPYVAMLSAAGALLGFLWATLSVRRFWQGENIAQWKGFIPGETYTYSVVWLLIGVALLIAGSRFEAKSLRLASAILVFATVVKVFLVDMSNLEGILRALSFIGLGAVLIGIGLFYQRILVKKEAPAQPPDS